jgi:hypothetical protein
MHYNTFQQVIDTTFKNNMIVKISIKISPLDFFNQKKSISEIHRTITNSKHILGGVSNRKFWQRTFKGGLYTYKVAKDYTLMEYYLNTQTEISEGLLRNLRTRIKKVIWCQMEIDLADTPIQEIAGLFKLDSIGIRFIGEGHKIKQQISTCHLIS